MIITRKYALSLLRSGKARRIGLMTDQISWAHRHNGRIYGVLNRHDIQRTDHYEPSRKEVLNSD
jgi:hypothetical protein